MKFFIGLTAFFIVLNTPVTVFSNTPNYGDSVVLEYKFYGDFHYSYDPNLPYNHVRNYNSNPLYVNQFDVGYAFSEFKLQKGKLRSTLAMHYGCIVDMMYQGEIGIMKNFREMSLEYHFTPKISLEGGVMPAHYGWEGFINKENWFATGATMTDFAPDFDLGTRLTYRPNEKWLIRLQAANGWQTLRETNNKKSFGSLIRYESEKVMVNWGTMTTDESRMDTLDLRRFYSNFFATFKIEKIAFTPLVDIGFQRDSTDINKFNSWQSLGVAIRYQIKDMFAIAARYEHINDPKEIIPELFTNTLNGFQYSGYTFDFEYTPAEHVTFRLEGRYCDSKDAVYTTAVPDRRTKTDMFILGSVAFSFSGKLK